MSNMRENKATILNSEDRKIEFVELVAEILVNSMNWLNDNCRGDLQIIDENIIEKAETEAEELYEKHLGNKYEIE